MVFGPKPRDFTKKVSHSTKQLALRKAMSERLRAGDVVVIDDLKLGSAKTKEFAELLFGSVKAAKTGVRTLVVFAESELASVSGAIPTPSSATVISSGHSGCALRPISTAIFKAPA